MLAMLDGGAFTFPHETHVAVALSVVDTSVSVHVARRVEAHLELNEFRLHIAQVASIARVENPQAAPMQSCEPLSGYILPMTAKPLVEGDV
jgi:hypothetical protein